MEANKIKPYFALFWSVVLTGITLIFGGAPLNVFRKTTSRTQYIVAGLVLTSALCLVGQLPFALMFFSLFSLVGLFCELDLRGNKLLTSAFVSIFGTAMLVGGCFIAWAMSIDGSWHAFLLEKVTMVLNLSSLPPEMKANLKVSELLLQLPSAVVVLLTLSLTIALVFEKKMMSMMGVMIVRKEPLNLVRLPEPLVFLMIAALAGAFLHGGNKLYEVVGVNFLNICAVLYFIQGMAVATKFFEVFKFGAIWRAIALAVLIVQMMPAVVLLGVLDLWFDFRTRFVKRATKMKKKGL